MNTSDIDIPRHFSTALADEIERNLDAALAEDLGAGDLTASLIPESAVGSATVITREAGVLCGRAWFEGCMRRLDEAVEIRWHAADGDTLSPGQLLCEIRGRARAILSAERTSLNFLQLLSAVASKTRRFVDVVAGTAAQIVDTRKTLPGLRLAQKYAVLCGGGGNHRIGLFDGILIKENHILAAGGIAPALVAAAATSKAVNLAAQTGRHCQFVEIEVESIDELKTALSADAQMILLDNFSLDQLREAVVINAGRAILEASGGVDFNTVRAIAETGVQRISVGALTKDVRALDLSLRFAEA